MIRQQFPFDIFETGFAQPSPMLAFGESLSAIEDIDIEQVDGSQFHRRQARVIEDIPKDT